MITIYSNYKVCFDLSLNLSLILFNFINFISTGSKRDKDNNVTLTTTSSKLYFHCKELDDVWQKEISNDNKIFSQTIKPKFYYLLNIDAYNFKEVPKLDGMALNFLLIGLQQEVISYDDLYDSILDLLLVGNQLDLDQRNLNRNSKLGPFGKLFYILCLLSYKACCVLYHQHHL